MTPIPRIAVTGASGALGGLVAGLLAERGQPQRLLVRDAQRAPHLPAATTFAMTYADRQSCLRALAGVSVVLMVSAAESPDRLDQHRAFVDAMVEAGVEHVVYTSFYAAAPDAVFTLARDHFSTEQYIAATGIGYTFLRDNFYIELMEQFVDDRGVIRGPAGSGRVSVVARSDIARAAAAVLHDPSRHDGKTYNLTGPEALTMAEIAATIADIRGQPVRFVEETIEEAYASRRHFQAAPWQLDAWVSTYTAIASGALSAVRPDLEHLTGRAPMTLRDHLISTR